MALLSIPPDPMSPIQRTATGLWRGDLRSGTGQMDAPSGVLDATPFTFATRFENAKGTNPEELIAAAHAACFSMAFSNYLAQQGHTPESIETKATITLDSGAITAMHLETRGRVPGVDAEAFAAAGRGGREEVPRLEPPPPRPDHHARRRAGRVASGAGRSASGV